MDLSGKEDFWNRLLRQAGLQEENVTNEPLLELCGSARVIIEHHCGVVEYGRERIRVRIKNGEFTVCGEELTLCRMCAEQLLIRGRIQTVQVQRGR